MNSNFLHKKWEGLFRLYVTLVWKWDSWILVGYEKGKKPRLDIIINYLYTVIYV